MNFTSINVDWYISTFLFYICIILICFFVTEKTENKVLITFTRKRILIWIVVVSLILLFIKGFGTTGRDLRNGYYNNFRQATSLSKFPDYTVETGYRLLNVIVRNITDQYPIFIFIVACLSIYPVMRLLKKYRDKIDLPIAILMYTSIYFFNGLSPLRMCLAASFGLFAFDCMVERKPWKAMAWIVIASFFHSTALVLFIPYFFSFLRALNKKMIATSLLFLFIVGYLGRGSISALMSGSDRYYIYSSFDNVSFGMEQIVYFAPLFFVYFKGKKFAPNKDFSIVAFAYLATAFCFGMMGYVISIFGRFRDLFVPLIIVVPYYIMEMKKRYPKSKNIINILAILYCVARFYVYISQYYSMEDLMPYTNIFGWRI